MSSGIYSLESMKSNDENVIKINVNLKDKLQPLRRRRIENTESHGVLSGEYCIKWLATDI